MKVIFFDAVGTLFHLPQGVGFHYAAVAKRHGWDLDEAALNEAFRSAWRAMPERTQTGEPRPDDDRGWWRELVGRVLETCIVPGAVGDREAYFAEVYEEFVRPGVWELFPEVRDVLAELSGRFELGVISNFDGRLRTILDQFGIAQHFKYLVISSEVGADKPHPYIFHEALRRVVVTADEALHVGDDPLLDWKAGASARLKVFKLDRPENSLHDLLAMLG